MTCRLCLKEKQLVDAHVIARCVHTPLMHGDGPIMNVSRELD